MTLKLNSSFVELPGYVAQPDDGSNPAREVEFMKLTKMICQNYASFSISDFLALSRSLDFPANELKRLFNSWTRKMVRMGRLEAVKGVYDDEIFVVA